jgi:hypothetical protein
VLLKYTLPNSSILYPSSTPKLIPTSTIEWRIRTIRSVRKLKR